MVGSDAPTCGLPWSLSKVTHPLLLWTSGITASGRRQSNVSVIGLLYLCIISNVARRHLLIFKLDFGVTLVKDII